MLDVRRRSGTDFLDYQQLVALLRGYSKPRDRIGRWLARGELVRVRKGLYVVGEPYRHRPVSRELLANLIYGPSYVSLDYALSHHGLIPERVEDVTSVTTAKARRFATPFGVFAYRPLAGRRYSTGMNLEGREGSQFLIATPEKALIDKVWVDKRFRPGRLDDFDSYLFDDLRMDDDRLRALDRDRLFRIASAFSSRRIDMLVRFISLRLVDSHE